MSRFLHAMIPVAEALRAVAGLLLPRACLLCGRQPLPAGRGVLCADCRQRVPSPLDRLCRWCGGPVPPGHEAAGRCRSCVTRPPHVREVRSPFEYDGVVRDLVHAFKFGAEPALGPVLGGWLGDWLIDHPFTRRPTLLVPIPLHPRRRRRRGFNQAALLARALSFRLGVPVATRILRRRLHTASQVGMGVGARRRNVRGAFAAGRRRELAGARVCLVDDVLTTGATVSEAARVLRRGGAGEVGAVALARAGSPGQASQFEPEPGFNIDAPGFR